MILDIRTKIILIILANYLLLKRVFGIYEFLVITLLFICMLLACLYRKAFIYYIIYLVTLLFEKYVFMSLVGNLSSFFSMLFIGGRLMLCCVMAGSYLISTTTTYNFVHGLRKWYISEQILITFAVMIRFLPMIKIEYRNLKEALKIRGLFLNFKDILFKPFKFYEYITVPLLMSATRWANDLTIASLTKGLSINRKATSYRPVNLQFFDYLVWLFVLIVFVGVESRFYL